MRTMITSVKRRLRSAGGRDRGSSAVELAILAPMLILMTMLIIQFALWFDARHAALAAAQEGDRIAREEAQIDPGTWQSDARTGAMNYFQSLDTSLLTHVTAQAFPQTVGGVNQVAVTVSGNLKTFIPITMTISVTVSGPVECFRTQASGGEQC